ncbi:MAG TPA: NAD(P)-binding domain-containing protein [Chryseosolibacter sp.]|nr:NAD(P)-binding domain-containing protein [Chryseosolibacter sp.]
MAIKKIGILGSGQVARVLAAGFVKHGYEVMVGSRDKEKLVDWRDQSGLPVQLGDFQQTAAFGELIVLSVKGTVAEAVVKDVSKHLSGKPVIDTTNPIAEAPPDQGVIKFFTDLNGSLLERLQHAVGDANFVKAFSSVGNARMVNPEFASGKPTMFICSNSEQAKQEVKKILDQFGWEVADMGKAIAARAIEPLCILWCIPGFLRNEWNHAFKLLRA